MTDRGTLWGVGLGPGDPELVTVKAARVIGEADVVAYHSARHGRSIARGIAERYLRLERETEQLRGIQTVHCVPAIQSLADISRKALFLGSIN